MKSSSVGNSPQSWIKRGGGMFKSPSESELGSLKGHPKSELSERVRRTAGLFKSTEESDGESPKSRPKSDPSGKVNKVAGIYKPEDESEERSPRSRPKSDPTQQEKGRRFRKDGQSSELIKERGVHFCEENPKHEPKVKDKEKDKEKVKDREKVKDETGKERIRHRRTRSDRSHFKANRDQIKLEEDAEEQGQTSESGHTRSKSETAPLASVPELGILRAESPIIGRRFGEEERKERQGSPILGYKNLQKQLLRWSKRAYSEGALKGLQRFARKKPVEYVQLTLLGRPPDQEKRDVTAPQPVDAAKSREMQDEKINTMSLMYGQAKDTYERSKKEYERNPSERNRLKRDDSFRTLKTVEDNLVKLHGDHTPANTQVSTFNEYPLRGPTEELTNIHEDKENANEQDAPWPAGNPKHVKSDSMPESMYMATSPHGREITVARSHSDSRKHAEFISGSSSVSEMSLDEHPAMSLPSSESAIFSDQSPNDSPVVSPTPTHAKQAWTEDSIYSSMTENDDPVTPTEFMPSYPVAPMQQQQKFYSAEDDDFGSEEETRLARAFETTDHGPFATFDLLRNRPAHLSVFLHFLISNSDPNPLLFYLVTDVFGQTQGSLKDMKKYAADIFKAFLGEGAPLPIVGIKLTSDDLEKVNSEDQMRNWFKPLQERARPLIEMTLKDYKDKRVIGLANIYGDHELQGREMSRQEEISYAEQKLEAHLKRFVLDIGNTEHSEAISAALATYIKSINGHIRNQEVAANCPPPFCAKDRLKTKFRTKRSTQDKDKKKKRQSYLGGVLQNFRKPSSNNPAATPPPSHVLHHLTHPTVVQEAKSRHEELSSSPVITAAPQVFHAPPPVQEADGIEQVRESQKVSSLVHQFQQGGDTVHTGTPPRSHSPDDGLESEEQKPSVNLSRSESLNRRQKDSSKKNSVRRTRSDVNADPNVIKSALNGSGSSSNSSLSQRGLDSPSTSTEAIPEAMPVQPKLNLEGDSDFETEQELPPLDTVLPPHLIKKLKPKEKKRQDVINELFHSEKAHVRSLKVMYKVFYIPMLQEGSMNDVVKLVFPNLDELLEMHDNMNKRMKVTRKQNAQVGDVAHILLDRFDGEEGQKFKNACATFCSNQSRAFEYLRHRRRKDQKFNQFLLDQASDPVCRRLEIKDYLPTVMQRLTKYPLLIENLMKYTHSNTDDFGNLQRALELSKEILAHVNSAVQECEMKHKLQEYQRRLDKKGIENTSIPSLAEFKNLDLSRHRMIYEGPLTWRINKHKTVELHCLLLETILVLLQKQDEKYVLKCHSSILGKEDSKYTHSPIIKLQDVLPKNVATDKRAFFVVSTSDTTPQIYDLVAMSTDEKRRWFRYLEEAANKAKENKKGSRPTPSKLVNVPLPSQADIPVRPALNGDESLDRVSDSELYDKKSVESVEKLHTAEEVTEIVHELVQPAEVTVSSSRLESGAEQVLTPLELLKRKDEEIHLALQERTHILADLFGIPREEFENVAEMADEFGAREKNVRSMALAIAHQTCRLMDLVKNRLSEHVPKQEEVASSSRDKLSVSVPMDSILQITSCLNRNVRSLVEALEVEQVESQLSPSQLPDQSVVTRTGTSLSPSNSMRQGSRPNSYISTTSEEEVAPPSGDSVILVTSNDTSSYILSPNETLGDSYVMEPTPYDVDDDQQDKDISEFRESLTDPQMELFHSVSNVEPEYNEPEAVTTITEPSVMLESSIQQVALEKFVSLDSSDKDKDPNANLSSSNDSVYDNDDTTVNVSGASF